MAEPTDRKRRKKAGNDVVEARIIADLVNHSSAEFQDYMRRRQAAPQPHPDAGAIRFPKVPTAPMPGGNVPNPLPGPDLPSPLLPDTQTAPMPQMPLPGPGDRQFPEYLQSLVAMLASGVPHIPPQPGMDTNLGSIPGMAPQGPPPGIPMPPVLAPSQSPQVGPPMPGSLPVAGVPAMPMPGGPIFLEDGSVAPFYDDPLAPRMPLDPFHPMNQQHLRRLLGLV